MKKLNLLILLLAIFIFESCKSKKDCTHYFTYEGYLSSSNNFNNNLSIRFNSLGNILFRTETNNLKETSKIDKSGHYKITSDFLTACESDENLLTETDTLKLEILYKEQVLQSEKYSFKDLNISYIDSTYTTIIKLPKIKLIKKSGNFISKK